MLDALHAYFDGEKYAGLLLAGISVAVLIAAAIMFRAGPSHRPFAATLGVFALIQIALGVGLYLRTGPQVAALVSQLGADAPAFYSAEAARMDRVQRNFVIIEYVELVIIVAAAIVAIAEKTRPGLSGVALGFLISASVLLAFDVIAERRGAEYVAAIGSGQRSG
jgi:hypothetical protein